MEDALPSAHTVLDRLKSEGTFDKFRKKCLAAIEEEPSFRAQKEHVEVLSRRFLQNFDIKEGKTKNDIRTKLRSFVTEEIKKPGVQVGQPIEKLIEKTLEAKGPEIFQKILEVIDKMQRTSPPPLPPDNPVNEEQNRPPPPEPLDEDNRVPIQENSSAPGPSQSSTSVSATFELPIDLLELPRFTNPLKREVKKSTKHKLKVDATGKEGNRGNIKTSTKHDSVERKANVKGNDGVTKNPKDKEEILKDCVTPEGSKTSGKKVIEGRVKESDTNDTNITAAAVTDNNDSSRKRRAKEMEKETMDENKTGLEDAEEVKEDCTSPDPENSSKSGVSILEPKLVVRRSARLASIEEEKRSDVSTSSSKESSSKSGRKRKGSLDIEMISEDETDDSKDSKNILPNKELKEDTQRKKKIEKSKPPSAKKRPVVSSGSEEEEDTEQTKPRKRGRRAASLRTFQRFSPTPTPPPPPVSPQEESDEEEDFERESKERISRTKKRKKI